MSNDRTFTGWSAEHLDQAPELFELFLIWHGNWRLPSLIWKSYLFKKAQKLSNKVK